MQNEAGVQLLYRVNIVANIYGDVTEFSIIDRPIEISLESNISDDECLAKIKSNIGNEDIILKSKITFVKIGMDEKQKLVKHFVLQKTDNIDNFIFVDIDALSGNIIGIMKQ
jgi:hypothetical protein